MGPRLGPGPLRGILSRIQRLGSFGELGDPLREARNLAAGRVFVRHALGNAAHDLRLRRLQGGLCRSLVAGSQRFLDLAGEIADAALAGVIDRRALGDGAYALLGRGDIGHVWS